MDYHSLSASSFADKIHVQRSSISHILSGRNKPSLDFVLKTTAAFKDIDMEWLLNGKGTFPKKEFVSEVTSTSSTPTLFNIEDKISQKEKKIQRIVLFFTDGTFEEYINK